MSLVICSNEIPSSSVRKSEFQSPFSFHNHLDQPLIIPANSEVAVQSLKINKEGSITLNQSTIWYEYFGVKLDAANKDLTTSAPHFVSLELPSNREATIDSAAKDYIAPALNRGVPNPETFGLATAIAKRDTEGNDFLGWEMTFEQRASGKSLDVKPTEWTNKFGTTGAGGGLTFSSASNTLTPTGAYGTAAVPFNQAIGESTPLALNEGYFEVDLSNLKVGAVNTNWGIGLTRCQTTAEKLNVLYNGAATDNFYPEIECDFLVGGFQDPGGGGNRWLRAYHSVEDSDHVHYDPLKPLSMRDIEYDNNGSFTTAYNWSTNSTNDQFTKLRYYVKNEDIKVDIYSASSTSWHVLVDSTGAKGKRFKPVADTCRNLYPFVFIQGVVGATQPYVTIDKWGGRNITGFTYSSPSNDWWSYLASVDLQKTLGKVVDTRQYNQFDGVNIGTAHTFKGINASATFEDYEYILAVQEDTDLYVPSDRAKASLFLGYNGQTIVEKTSINASSVVTFLSEDVPTLKSTTNLFVRLNNYNVQSYNAGQSSTSKIIYAAPRFSTGTEQSIGALFFESPERLYLSLNNPSDMVSNMFDISIVNDDNTLATDLRGKTVVILHFREKK